MQFFGGDEIGLQFRFLRMKKRLELRKGVLFPLFGRGFFFFLQMRHSSARRQSTLNDESRESSNFRPYSLISLLFGSCRLLGAETISAFAGAPLTVTNLSSAASTVVISACCAFGKLGCQKACCITLTTSYCELLSPSCGTDIYLNIYSNTPPAVCFSNVQISLPDPCWSVFCHKRSNL